MENKAISSDLIRGHVDTIILHALLGGDKFPQQISDLIEQKSDKQYEINQATLYSSLKRLETLKFVQSYWHDTENGRRKYYKLTEVGKKTVDANLSNWSYSRAIIDKLMDVEPTAIVKTEYVDRIVDRVVIKEVQVPVYEPNPEPVRPEIKQQEFDFEDKNEPSSIKVSEPIVYQREESDKEKNFRNILNGLIVATRKNVTTEKKVKPITANTAEVSENPAEIAQQAEVKPLFSETIEETHKYALKDNIGKIDFGDLSVQVAKDGYKLRISAKGPRIAKGSLFVNKINLLSSFAVFLVAMLELLIVSLTCKSFINFGVATIIVPIIIMAFLPATMYALYRRAPLKTTRKVRADTMLTSIIIVFNLILITFAVSLLFNIDLSNIRNLCDAFIFPMLVYIDIFLFFAFRYLIARYPILNVKKDD